MHSPIRRALSFLLAPALLSLGLLDAAPLRDSATAKGLYIGASIDLPIFRSDPPFSETLRREFNMLVAGNAFKWDALRPSRTTFSFTNTDELLNYATTNTMAFRGHTLVWHNQLPGWLVNGTFTRDEMIAILREHILTVVGRYRGRILAWDVVNEGINDSNGQLRTDSIWFQRIGPEYVALAFQFAHEADPNAILYYNDYNGEGLGTKSNGIFTLVSGLIAQGVPIHGVGWQMHLISGMRIGADHRANAQRLAALGLEISITEMDVRIQLPTDAAKLQTQALAYRDAADFALTTPNCAALVIWGLTDKDSWIPSFFPGFGDALLFDASYLPKPGYFAIRDILEAGLAQPPSAPSGVAAASGNLQVQLSWSAALGATSYTVKRSTTSGGPYPVVGTTATTSFTNTALTNGTTYFYVVSASNAIGESANSMQVSATPQPPNFSLSVGPANVTLGRGTSGLATVAIARVGGFTSSVDLSATGLPAGVTATFSPDPATGGTSTLTLTASLTATLGATPVTITGVGTPGTHTTTLNLTVNDAPCANPVSIALPFAQNGVGEFCFVTSGTISFINSWNMQLVEVNGVAFTNVFANTLPPRINGSYYIHCIGVVSFAHFEANGSGGGTTDTLTVAPTSLSLAATAGSSTFAITSNVSWTVTDDQTWITATPASGANNGTVTVAVVANTAATARTGTVTVTGGGLTRTVAITQASATPTNTLTVAPATLSFVAAAGSGTFAITSNVSWTVTDDQPWITATPASGANNGTVTVAVVANTAATARTGTVTVTGGGGGLTRTVAITQAGATPTNTLTVAPASLSFPAPGGSATFAITSNVSWAVTDDQAWLTVAPVSGSNNATLTVTAPANTAATARTGTVTVTGGGLTRTVAITQAGATVTTPCANPTAIPLPFAQNGAGDFCFVTSGTINFINSWNVQSVEINGVAFTNQWQSGASLPPRINGNYYIHYVANVAWAHFEASASP